MALTALADFSVTVAASAIGLTSSELDTVATKMVMATCTVETAQIRINDFGTPTAGGTEGSHIKNVGDVFNIWGVPSLRSFLAIRTGSTSGALRVTVYGTGEN